MNAGPAAGSSSPPLLEVLGIRKSYGVTTVLGGVSISLAPDERHGLLGENGAGKSTLIKIISGLVQPDAGTVGVDGVQLRRGVRGAREAGIRIVQQELSLVPTVSIAENAVLGEFPSAFGLVRRAQVRERGEELVELVGLTRKPGTAVERLPFAERQLVEIGRALLGKARILLLDEPTSALSPAEVDRLFSLLQSLTGTAVIYVSHRMDEVYRLCSSASVLRDGQFVDRFELSQTDVDTVVRAMVGRQVELLKRREPVPEPELDSVVLEACSLSGPGVREASLSVRGGEICGIAGFVGSGRTELLRLLCGLAQPLSGAIRFRGRPVRLRSMADAARLGIAYVPEERQAEGLALQLTSAENAVAPSLPGLARLGLLNRSKTRRRAAQILSDANVRPAEPGLTVGHLSGGNQQKLVVGRWAALAPPVFLLDEPTRGVDVAARSEIHRVLDTLARAGSAVVVVSSELPELLTIADRIVVMHEGQTVGELTHKECTEQSVMQLATGLRAAT